MLTRSALTVSVVVLAMGCGSSSESATPAAGGSSGSASGGTSAAGSSGDGGPSGAGGVAGGEVGGGGGTSGADGASDAGTVLDGSVDGSGGEDDSGAVEPQGEIVIATGQMTPTGLAVDDDFVYWANSGDSTIVRCPINGCDGAEPTLVASNVTNPRGLDVDTTTLYWMDSSGKGQKCPITGCTGVPQTVFQVPEVNRALDLDVSGDHLYFASWPSMGSCPVSGCVEEGPQLFARTSALAIDSDGEALFVATNAGIITCSLDNCDAQSDQVLLYEAPRRLGIATDATHVYFGESEYLGQDDSSVPSISRCPIMGCGDQSPEVLKDEDVSPFAIAVNATRIFFTNYDHGTVVSMPKP